MNESMSNSVLSKRRLDNLHRADNVARELRYLIAKYGHVSGDNSGQLMAHLVRWMSTSPKTKYIRPKKLKVWHE